MEKLKPFEELDDDYYMDVGGWRDDDSANEASSDDEFQTELKKLAGIPQCNKKLGKPRGDFESDMEDQLDRSICDYADEHMGGKESLKAFKKEAKSSADVFMEGEANEISPKSQETDEKEDNPIKSLVNKTRKNIEQEEIEFYDPDEDEDNEKWVEAKRRKAKGGESSKSKGKIDNDSDAVLSCPGCMNLLTRDCQRHELYKDQYRAMFVENCTVNTSDKLTIEKTGKEKRRQRQKQKKQGIFELAAIQDDIFYPVRCKICTTKVAVMDNDEVYHFFNVLTGYA